MAVQSHCEVVAPVASQLASTWTQLRSILMAPGQDVLCLLFPAFLFV